MRCLRLCSVLCVTFALGGAVVGAEKPHLVVFLSDDHGQLDSTPYGATDVRTPNMQRLATAGMTFTHAFVASPACAPSRAALLTGRMPARNGAEANHTYKRDDVPSLPRVLQQLGYQTAAFGKVAHGKDADRHGFDVIEPRHDVETVRSFLASRKGSQPLCLFVGTHEPHVPWPDIEGYSPEQVTLPPTFIDTPETREFRTRYYTDVTKADTLLGEIYDLSNEVLGTETLFLYSSDHGAQWPFGKWTLYDAGIRVPMIAVWPGKIAAGSESPAMVQWTDLLPTLIDAGGGEVPDGLDGRSFLPVLLGKTEQHRDVIYTTHTADGAMNNYPSRSIRTRDWKLIWNLRPDFAFTTHIDKALARDGGRYWISWFERTQNDEQARQIVARYHQRPEFELYHLPGDPHEQQNLAADPDSARRVQEMHQQLQEWIASQGDQLEIPEQQRLLTDPGALQPGPDAGKNNRPRR